MPMGLLNCFGLDVGYESQKNHIKNKLFYGI